MEVGLDGTTIAIFGAVFVASLVESVEAFTIVLAMGVTRGWRSAIAGTGVALIALVALSSLLGVAITTWVSESLLQLVIGSLLLIFGLQWLRKAVLRSSGLKSLHDEDDEFERQSAAAREAERTTYAGIDLFGFMVSFKGVLLEGTEVVFIVVTFGLSDGAWGWATAGALLAVVVVLALGIALRRPLAAIPENTLKYGVAVLLSAFGLFWSIEGTGYFQDSGESISWPGHEFALIVLVVMWIAVSQLTVAYLRRLNPLDAVALTGEAAR
jgi:uncharacterized membrane protein